MKFCPQNNTIKIIFCESFNINKYFFRSHRSVSCGNYVINNRFAPFFKLWNFPRIHILGNSQDITSFVIKIPLDSKVFEVQFATIQSQMHFSLLFNNLVHSCFQNSISILHDGLQDFLQEFL